MKLKLKRCSHSDCNRRAKVARECKLCEKKGSLIIHTIVACGRHADWSLSAMKSHVMRKHPAVLPRLVIGALKGEDVF